MYHDGKTYLTEEQVYDFMFEAHTEPCKRYKLMEKHLHMLANKFRILNSEWHKMTEDDVNNALMRLGSLEYYNR